MKAMILAAGLGTRLMPLTERCPKPLLPMLLSPILDHILRQLKQCQITEVVVNLHHHAEQLRDWLGDGSRWGVQIHLSHEVDILGSAGALKRAEAWLRDEPFFVVNADVLADIDLPTLWQWHCEREALVTMVLRPDPSARQYGVVLVDADDRIHEIAGQPPPSTPVAGEETMFTGVQVVSPRVLEWIEPEQFVGTTADIYPALIAAGERVLGYRYTGYWMDVGSPERYRQAHWDLIDGALGNAWMRALPTGTQFVLDERDRLENEVTIVPPVVIGPDVELAAKVCMGPYAVIGPGCRLGEGAVVRESVLWDGVQIG
ncbi:MAG: NDP-sugar synthase, partial [Candidatus Tectomicrobia bacterium]|nr:NDP-sugar synthase [Candidatus Tectomicrobia bacterium]